jgi:hypothetical protein
MRRQEQEQAPQAKGVSTTLITWLWVALLSDLADKNRYAAPHAFQMRMAIILGHLHGGLAMTSHLATKLKNAFYFNYPEAKRDKDLGKIPKLWSDVR